MPRIDRQVRRLFYVEYRDCRVAKAPRNDRGGDFYPSLLFINKTAFLLPKPSLA